MVANVKKKKKKNVEKVYITVSVVNGLIDASQLYLLLKFSAELGYCMSEVHCLINPKTFRKQITHNTYLVYFFKY